LRRGTFVVASILTVIALSQVAAANVDIDMPDKHISLSLPPSWSYERNASIDGETFDLEFESPVLRTSIAMGLLSSETWIGNVSYDRLQSTYDISINFAETEEGVERIDEITPASNTIVSGFKAVDGLIKVTYTSALGLYERMIFIASDGWNLGWVLIIGCLEVDYGVYSEHFDSIVSSIAIEDEPAEEGDSGPSPLSLLFPMIAGACVAAAAVAVLFLLRGRKKEEANLVDPLDAYSAPDEPASIQVISPESPTQQFPPPTVPPAQPEQTSGSPPKVKIQRTLKKSVSETRSGDQPPQT